MPDWSSSTDVPDTTLPRFHLGDKIKVDWKAPSNHSRSDWIGIYKYDADQSKSVTRLSSRGKWWGVHWDDWEGDQWVATEEKKGMKNEGVITFMGNKLPWTAGKYEVRYHHGGKHNVMKVSEPFVLYGMCILFFVIFVFAPETSEIKPFLAQ